MSILIIAPNRDENIWKKSFIDYDPNIKVFNSRDTFDDESIDCVVVWNHPQGVLKKYKNLKLIYSMGAGVDHVFNDSELPEDIPICKIVDDRLSFSMSNYIIMAILNYHRRFYKYQSDKKNKVWDQESNPEINLKIGILGFGILGKDAAEKLKKLNFDVIGYSLTKKEEKEIDVYFGNKIDLFLSKINVLVCTVPYTKSTHSLLNKDLFNKLKTPTYLINVSRGKVHVEKDILDGIESGKLTGAFLDVFEKEPLPKDSPLWKHPKIKITPHVASLTYAEESIRQALENYQRIKNGKKLINEVSRDKMY